MTLFWCLRDLRVFSVAVSLCAVYLTADGLAWNVAMKRMERNEVVRHEGITDEHARAINNVLTILREERENRDGKGSNARGATSFVESLAVGSR